MTQQTVPVLIREDQFDLVDAGVLGAMLNQHGHHGNMSIKEMCDIFTQTTPGEMAKSYNSYKIANSYANKYVNQGKGILGAFKVVDPTFDKGYRWVTIFSAPE